MESKEGPFWLFMRESVSFLNLKGKPVNLTLLFLVTLASIIVGWVLKQRYGTDWFELVGFVTGVVGVYLVAVEHIWNWPIGIVNVLVYAYVFYVGKLFGDMGLMFFFAVIQVQGWHAWLHGGEQHDALPISKMEPKEWKAIFPYAALGVVTLIPLITWMRGAAPVIDSVLTVISIAAQLMTNRKKLECWLLWILADIFYIPLYISRGFEATGLLYGIFLVLAVMGYVNWKRTMALQASPSTQPESSPYPRSPGGFPPYSP